MSLPPLHNSLRAERTRRGWSQAAVAAGSGLSRAAISAIETGRTAPSAAAALALARLFGTGVESLFQLEETDDSREQSWAWDPRDPNSALWSAVVGGHRRNYPVEATAAGILTPDDPPATTGSRAESTLVIAGCDPAVGILSGHLAEQGVRLLPFIRSSGQALDLLGEGSVHAAGIHLQDNREAVIKQLGDGYCLLHLACWDQGLSMARGLGLDSIEAAIAADLRWVGRQADSGARHCLDRILAGKPRPRGYGHEARDHESVAQTIATGWAQAGICVRLTADQAGLDFLSVQEEAYELVLSREFLGDPRGEALLRTVRSRAFGLQLTAAAGYDTSRTGDLEAVRLPS